MNTATAENQIVVAETAREIAQIQMREQLYRAKKDVIRAQVAPGTNDVQLEVFFTQAARYNLDPLAKEIWCVNMGQGIQIFTGRDGFLKLAQQNPDFDGITSETVCEGDDFDMDPVSQKITHKFGQRRGNISGAYSIVYNKRRRPTIVYADFKEYSKNRAPWTTHPSAMIKKVAEVNALKRAFGLSGFSYDEAEAPPQVWADPIKHADDPIHFNPELLPPVSQEAKQNMTGAGIETLPGEEDQVPPAQTGELTQVHPSKARAKFFGLAKELDLPPHEGDWKAYFYTVIPVVLGFDYQIDTLRAITDEQWTKLATWLKSVKEGRGKLPNAFAEAKARYTEHLRRKEAEPKDAEFREDAQEIQKQQAADDYDPFADEKTDYKLEFLKYNANAQRPALDEAPEAWALVFKKLLGKNPPQTEEDLNDSHWPTLANDAAGVAAGNREEHESLASWKEANAQRSLV